MNVAVIGAGKMGLPLACAFASRGANVTACDIDAALVATINEGRCPFDEPGLAEVLQRTVASGALRATTEHAEAIGASEVIVVLIPVLLNDRKEADLSQIVAVTNEIAAHIRAGSMVSYETTLPVGQTRALGAALARDDRVPGVDFDLVFSPERVKSRSVLEHLSTTPKIVGGVNQRSSDRGAEFYRRFLGAPVIDVGTLEAAELVKLAGMVYRDVNIALANELAAYAAHWGTDFAPVREAANTDGESALLIPGIGVGGHCTPVYPYFVTADPTAPGDMVRLAAAARMRNEDQPERVLQRLGDLTGVQVLILGIGFRPQVKEATCSPAFALSASVLARGGVVRAHDPLYSDEEIRRLGFEPGGLDGNDVLILNTAHDEYRSLDFERLAANGLRTVVDGRNLWSPAAVTGAGLRYIGIGRPDVP